MDKSLESGGNTMQYGQGDWIAGEYHVLDIFGGSGKSGQGVVYLVEHRDAPQPFVLKTVQGVQDAAGKARLAREAEVWVSSVHRSCFLGT